MYDNLYTMFSLLQNVKFQNLKSLTTHVFKIKGDLSPQHEICELQANFNMPNLRCLNIHNFFEMSEPGISYHSGSDN